MTAINLDPGLVDDARIASKVFHRSVPKQIEHWARIGHIAEDNPDLSYEQIKEILLGLQEYKQGKAMEYERGML